MSFEPNPERVQLNEAERRAQRRRSIAIGIVLTALVVLFYVITVIKMGS